MLDRIANSEMLFDEVLTKAIPYLIFAPREFAAVLSAHMAGLWQTYEDDKGGAHFIESVEAIKKMLDFPDEKWDPGVAMQIRSFNRERTGLTSRVRAIEKRLDLLVAKMEPLKKPISTPSSTGPYVKPVKQNVPTLEPGKYKAEMKRFTAMLAVRKLSPHCVVKYQQRAKKLLNMYGTNLPSEETFNKDLMKKGYKKTNICDMKNTMKILRIAVQPSGASP